MKVELNGDLREITGMWMTAWTSISSVVVRCKELARRVAQRTAPLVQIDELAIANLSGEIWLQNLEEPCCKLGTIDNNSMTVAKISHEHLLPTTSVHESRRKALPIHACQQFRTVIFVQNSTDNTCKRAAPIRFWNVVKWQVLHMCSFALGNGILAVHEGGRLPWLPGAIWIVVCTEALARSPLCCMEMRCFKLASSQTQALSQAARLLARRWMQ